MHVIVPPLYLWVDLPLFMTEYRLNRIVPHESVGLYVPVPDHIGCRLRDESKPFVGALDSALRLALIGHVNHYRDGGNHISFRIEHGGRAHADESVCPVPALNSDLF